MVTPGTSPSDREEVATRALSISRGDDAIRASPLQGLLVSKPSCEIAGSSFYRYSAIAGPGARTRAFSFLTTAHALTTMPTGQVRKGELIQGHTGQERAAVPVTHTRARLPQSPPSLMFPNLLPMFSVNRF